MSAGQVSEGIVLIEDFPMIGGTVRDPHYGDVMLSSDEEDRVRWMGKALKKRMKVFPSLSDAWRARDSVERIVQSIIYDAA